MANELDRIRALRQQDQPLYGRINPITDIEGSLSNVVQQSQQNLNMALQNSPRATFERQQQENQYLTDNALSDIDLGLPQDSVPSGQLQSMEGLPPITQTFGQKSQYDVFSGGVNYGVDFGVKAGTPVGLPAGQWVVEEAFNQAKGQGRIGDKTNSGYGNSVLVRNAKTGETLRLSHLSNVAVQPGQVIPGGTVIATSGATGNVTGPHLDVEYRDPSGRLGDVLRTPYARSLVGRGGGASLGRGGGNPTEAQNTFYNQRAIYGDSLTSQAGLSSFPIIPNINYRGIQNYLAERNLPGQVITGALADRQNNDPRWTGLQKMRVGLPLTDAEKGAIKSSSAQMVMGTTAPIQSKQPLTQKINLNRFNTQTEDFQNALEDVLQGNKSMTKLPVLVDIQKGKVGVVDGNHRIAQALLNNEKSIEVMTNEPAYRKLSELETNFRPYTRKIVNYIKDASGKFAGSKAK